MLFLLHLYDNQRNAKQEQKLSVFTEDSFTLYRKELEERRMWK